MVNPYNPAVQYAPNVGDVEARAGVEPLDVLLAERDALVRKLSRLRGLYGPVGLFGHHRKIELARIAAMLRAQYTADGTKVSEARIDEEAHSHPDYAAFIAHGTVEAAQWVEAEEMLESVTMRVSRGQALLRYLSSEPKV